MTVTPSSPVVGIFKDRSMAEQAIDALYNAGFTSEQVRYSVPGTSGSILADLKNLFTGQNASSGNIANDLTDMGLSNEEAQYYSNEYNNGNTILAVSASSREQEILNILHQYGAYNARANGSSPDTIDSQQPSDSIQQATYTPDETSPRQDGTPTWATQEQPADTENHPFQNTQQNIVTSASDTEAQNYQSDEEPVAQNTERQPTEPLVPGYHSAPQGTSSHDVGALEATPDSEVTPYELTTPDATPVYQTTAPDQTVTDSTVEPQATQIDVTPSDATVTDSTPTSQNTPLSTTAPSEYGDEFEQLQAQLQASQQQLQDARAQLQSAKEQEAQVQTIRERERQLQDARQQLQDIQAQLQATLAELHETHQRISQYQ